MFNKKFIMMVLGLGLGLASVAAAQGGGSTPNIGFMYKFELENNDDGLLKDSKADVPSTTMSLDVFRLVADGTVMSDKLTWAARVAMEGGLGLDYGYFKYKLSDKHSVLFGKEKVRVGGWEHRNGGPLAIVESIYMNHHQPFHFSTMVGFENTYSFGAITVQLVEDVTHCSAAGCTGWNAVNASNQVVQKQPAFVLEYIGDFNGIKPLFQYAMYDLAHSSVMTVGVGYEGGPLNVEFDYTMDQQAEKGANATTAKSEDQTDAVTAIALNARYKITEWVPFLHYSAYNEDEYTASGVKKSSVNANAAGSPTPFNDNGATIGLGVEYHEMAKNFVPYGAYVRTSGKFTNLATKEADFTQASLLAGVKGEF